MIVFVDRVIPSSTVVAGRIGKQIINSDTAELT